MKNIKIDNSGLFMELQKQTTTFFCNYGFCNHKYYKKEKLQQWRITTHQKYCCIFINNLVNSFHVKVELKKNDNNILSQEEIYDYIQIEKISIRNQNQNRKKIKMRID